MANEENRFSARAARYVRVGTNVGAVAARVAGGRLLGRDYDPARAAADLAAALGGLKGPLMKVAQFLSTIPEALPAEYARELMQLQSAAPADGTGLRAGGASRPSWGPIGRSASKVSRWRPRPRPRSARCTARSRTMGAGWR